MTKADDRPELAARAWRLLLGAGQRRMEAMTREIEAMGLSKAMVRFLTAICESPPGPTNQLATRFGVAAIERRWAEFFDETRRL